MAVTGFPAASIGSGDRHDTTADGDTLMLDEVNRGTLAFPDPVF
jgi:hypothetical protein